MKPFRFQKFNINQSEKVFRVGTDGVLLGIFCTVKNAKHILEVGTGSGLISLMLAQRNLEAEILAIELNSDAAKLASENFKDSPFKKQLQVIHKDYKKFKTEIKFDLIVSNPPYFEENSSEKDVIARQQTELNFDDLIEKSAQFLSDKGLLSVIIPYEEGANFEKKCSEMNLHLHRKIKIFGIKNAKPKRWILEFSNEQKDIEESEFVIEKSPRVYSDEYLELTKDFHVFTS